MKEKYDVPIAPESEFVSYMMEQMTNLVCHVQKNKQKTFMCITRA